MNKSCVFALGMLLAVPAAAFAQHSGGGEMMQSSAHNISEDYNRMSQHNSNDISNADHQSWLGSMAAQTKLRAKLAESWQNMGLSPEAAKQVADAYDPALGAYSHHTSLRGKSDDEVATMLRSEVAAKHYQKANQMLVDYQRQKLNLDPMSASH